MKALKDCFYILKIYLLLLKFKIVLRRCYQIDFTPSSFITDFVFDKIQEPKTLCEMVNENKFWDLIYMIDFGKRRDE